MTQQSRRLIKALMPIEGIVMTPETDALHKRCSLLVVHIETIEGYVHGLAEYAHQGRLFGVMAHFRRPATEDNMLCFFEHIEILINEYRYRRFSFAAELACEDCYIWEYSVYTVALNGQWGEELPYGQA